MKSNSIKGKELAVLVGMIIAFVLVLSLTGLYFRNRQAPEKNKEDITLVEGTISPDQNQEHTNSEPVKIGSDAFFLKPSADEVLTALKEAAGEGIQELPIEHPPMKVMWPGYFFSVERTESGEGLMQLDVDENGFGVVLVCSVKLDDYPQVTKLTQGQKIWVAGQVTAIDMDGTGGVHITVEYIRFDDGPTTGQ
ncbi:MAG: hypothetical protein D6B25_06485 [Desulfobulbaceae bacterium]|mgnify:CR=1 FL=1|nr:MAG: hypothetical protein D6B25_06485 [Desulfobulbaceae bacterium]